MRLIMRKYSIRTNTADFIARIGGGAYLPDRNTCAGNLAENGRGAGLIHEGGTYS